jgi:hypothetical protein
VSELASPLLPLEIPEPSAALALLQDGAGAYARASKAANTLRSYRTDLADFQAWCQVHGLPALPASPSPVALYIRALAQAGCKVATIQHRLDAISQAHQLSGHSPSPTSHPEVAGIRRSLGTAQEAKAPLVTASALWRGKA